MKRLIAVLLFAVAQPLFATCGINSLTITPPRPVTSDDIEVVIRGGCGDACIPYSPRVVVGTDTITIELDQFDGCILIPVEFGERVDVGRVPAGTYTLVVKTEREELARQTLVVRDPPFAIRPSFGAPGTQVVIETLALDEAQAVLFGGVPATPIGTTPVGYPIVVVPPHAPGLADVTVTAANGQSLTATQAFLYPAPQADLSGEHERVLFPVAFEGPGAHGSQWTTENIVANTMQALVTLPNNLTLGRTKLPNTNQAGGAFLFVPRGAEPWLAYSSHIVDRSRRQTDAGTEMRVVHDDETGPALAILNVPFTSESRQTLRIYDFDALDRTVSISIVKDGATLHSTSATLTGRIVCVTTPCYPQHPTFAVLNLDAVPALRGVGAADIHIQTRTNEAPLWAFVSVTNNDTQHVTTFTPQHRRQFYIR